MIYKFFVFEPFIYVQLSAGLLGYQYQNIATKMCTRKNVSSKPYKAFWSYKKVGAHQIYIKDKQKLHLQTSPNTLFAGLTNIVLEYHISFCHFGDLLKHILILQYLPWVSPLYTKQL